MTDDMIHFRRVMGHFATGVTVVTTLDRQGRPVGLTANSVTSVSLNPRLLLVAINSDSTSLATILAHGRFGVSVLTDRDERIARRFSEGSPDHRFVGLPLESTPSGIPVLAGALAWLDCKVWKTVDAGDHLLLLGEVVDCGIGVSGEPLIFFRGRYGLAES